MTEAQPSHAADDDPGFDLEVALKRAFAPPLSGPAASSVLDWLQARHRAAPGHAGGPRYQIVREVDRGGMGIILEGRDTELGRPVALKVLQGDAGSRPDLLARFVEEAQIGGQLQHPGVLPVYDLGLLPDGRPFFAMKLIEGRTLADLLAARRTLGDERRRFLTIFEQVCQTVAYAHARGVVHRDLKPANILVGAFGEVHVGDWGLAKVQGGREDEAPDLSRPRTVRTERPAAASHADTVLGTPVYMAPEQAAGCASGVDARADVFALGGILLEILTGVPPYQGADPHAVRGHARSADLGPALARLGASDADPALDALVRDCLAAAPAERPADASAVAARVTAHLAATEERARSAEIRAAQARARGEEAQRTRRRTRLLAGLAVLLTLIVAAGTLWVGASEQEQRRSTEGQVLALLAETTRLTGLAAAGGGLAGWQRALTAATAARDTARATRHGQALRARAEAALASCEQEHATAQRKQSEHEADVRMVDRLLSVRTQLRALAAGDTQAEQDRAYAAAFRDYGVEVDTLPEVEAVQLLRARAIHLELGAGLDDWVISRRRSQPKEPAAWERLLRIADGVDADPWRRELRAAYAAQDAARLRALAEGAKVERLPVASLNRLGLFLIDRGERASGVDLLERASFAHPGDLLTHLNLAWWLTNLGRPADAVAHYHAALALAPDRAATWMNLAAVTTDPEQGMARMRRACVLGPDQAAIRYNMALHLEQRGMKDEAISHLRAAIDLDPQLVQAHNNLGVLLAERGESQEAERWFVRATETGPDSPEGWRNLGQLRFNAARHEDALAPLRRAVELRPDHGESRRMLAFACYKTGRKPDALPHFLALAGLQPAVAWWPFHAGSILVELGRRDEARAQFDQALAIDPSYAKARAARDQLK